MIEQDSQILTNIHQTLIQTPDANQRILAQNSNISLGQMNAVLKRCMERGWIAVKNLNMKKVCYYLTPAGLDEVSTRTTRYMKNTFSLMNEYAGKIEKVLQQAKEEGKTKVVLVGKSNIDFLIEYECVKLGLSFEKAEQNAGECGKIEGHTTLVLFSENVEIEKTANLEGFSGISLLEI